MLTFLLTGTAYSEQLPNKPYRVCPEIVTAKDTPCRVLTPEAAIVHRMEIPKDNRDRDRVKLVIDMLRELADRLEKDLKASEPVR